MQNLRKNFDNGSPKGIELKISIHQSFTFQPENGAIMSKSNQIIDLLIGGEAGQGLVTVGLLLSKAIASTGYEVLATQTYLSRIRGGHNTYQIRVGDTSPRSAGEEIDLLIALDGDSIPLHSYQLKNGGLIIGDEGLFSSPMSNGVAVPFREMGPSRTMNVAALGVAASIMGLSLEIVEQQVKTAFTKAGQKVLDENLSALRASYDWSRNRSIPFSNPITPREKAPRMLMTGNEAIGMGALAAGLKFCAFYPMTPSTSIVMTVIKYSQSLGCVVEQAEDEIAAVNMAIGASFCGAPAMVATSGGGFALMTEGVSLAGMTETPLVIAVAQRPGPATGLPTRTEQADLNLVLYAGHGEFPRAVFTPTDVTECFHIARKSFEIAERYQTPVFILTDQLLADSLRTIPPLSAEKGAVGYAPADPSEIAEPYRRYFITQDGISPRLLPGQSPHLVRADSDEHDENGLINEDPANRILMNEKRLKKGLKLAQ